MIRGVIFDLDGVLVDSAPAHAWAYRQLFAEQGFEFTAQDFREVGWGVPRADVIQRVLGQMDEARLWALCKRKAALVVEYLAKHRLPGIPGGLELARDLDKRGVPIAVATVSRMPLPFLAAAGGEGLFKVVVDGNDIERKKPHPDVYLEAARKLGLDPAQTLAIEDSPPGVQAAHSAGCTVIGLATHGDARALSVAHAVVQTFDEIRSLPDVGQLL